MKNWIRIIALILAVVLLANVVRLFFYPPAYTLTAQSGDVTVEIHTDRQYVWYPDDCVTITWTTQNTQTVVINTTIVPASGSSQFCPDTGLVKSYDVPARTDLLGELTGFDADSQDAGIFAYFNDQLSFIHLHLPIYVLLSDWLWTWQVFIALLLIWWVAGIRLPVRVLKKTPIHIAVAWLLIILSSYIAVYFIWKTAVSPPPDDMGFTLERLSSLVQLPMLAGVMIIYILAAQGLGALIIYSRLRPQSALTRLVTAFLLGQNVLALMWLCLGLVGWLRPLPLVVVLIISIVSGGIRHGRELTHDIQSLWLRLKNAQHHLPRKWRWLLNLSFLWLFVLTLQSINPPFVDGPITYLLNAKLFAVSHQLTPISDGSLYYYIMSGMTGELHMAALMLLQGETSARLFTWVILVALTLTLVALGDLFTLERRGKAFLIIMMVTTTVATYLAGDGKVDIFGAALVLIAVYWTVQHPKVSHPMLIGLFSGFSVMAKVTYGPTLALFIALYTLYLHRTTPRYLVMLWIRIGFWALLPLLFHIVRNGVILGEPFTPFYNFSMKTLNPVDTFLLPWADERMIRNLRVLYPFGVTFHFFPYMYGGFTPLWLSLLPLFFWRYPKDKMLRTVSLIALICLAIWVLLVPTVSEVRYVMAIALVLYIPLVDTLPHLLHHKILEDFLVVSTASLLIVYIATTLFFTGRAIFFSFPDNPECLTDTCVIYNIINHQAGENDRVLSNHREDYYLRGDLLRTTTTREERAELLALSPEQRWEYLYEHGFVYILDSTPSHGGDLAINQYYKMVVPLYLDAVPPWLSVTTLIEKRLAFGLKGKVYRLDLAGETKDTTGDSMLAEASGSFSPIMPSANILRP